MTMMTVDGLDDYNDLLFSLVFGFGLVLGLMAFGSIGFGIWFFVFSPCSDRVSRISLR
jgi:hypothetical protein